MTKRVFYEKDFKKREVLSHWFKDHDEDVVICFSLEKLKLVAKKNDNEELIIFIRNEESDYSFVRENFAFVVDLDNEDPLQNIDALNLQSKSFIKGMKKGGGYDLDLLCIGSSTGGLPILKKILKGINQKKSIIIICQHISEKHHDNVYETLKRGEINKKFALVKESTILGHGLTYILSGGTDFEIRQKYGKLYLEPIGLSNEDYHPSFNTLTGSMLKLKGLKLGCMIMSGLGNDGAKHLKNLKVNQVKIVVQDPEEAIAPYMPKAAIATGVVDHIYNELSLNDYLRRCVA